MNKATRAPVVAMQNRLKIRMTKTVEFYETVSLDTDIDLDTIDEGGDPAETIPRRVEQLARMLGCSETEAQRVLFSYM